MWWQQAQWQPIWFWLVHLILDNDCTSSGYSWLPCLAVPVATNDDEIVLSIFPELFAFVSDLESDLDTSMDELFRLDSGCCCPPVLMPNLSLSTRVTSTKLARIGRTHLFVTWKWSKSWMDSCWSCLLLKWTVKSVQQAMPTSSARSCCARNVVLRMKRFQNVLHMHGKRVAAWAFCKIWWDWGGVNLAVVCKSGSIFFI